MKTRITSTEEIIDNQTVSIWRLENDEKETVININKLINEDVSNCFWQDDAEKYLTVEYTDWDGTELIAIVNENNTILRKGIRSIEEYLDKHELFIINISGYGLGEEAGNYALGSDDWKMAVIDFNGRFIIPPEYDRIFFEEDGNIFYAENLSNENKYQFSIAGKSLN